MKILLQNVFMHPEWGMYNLILVRNLWIFVFPANGRTNIEGILATGTSRCSCLVFGYWHVSIELVSCLPPALRKLSPQGIIGTISRSPGLLRAPSLALYGAIEGTFPRSPRRCWRHLPFLFWGYWGHFQSLSGSVEGTFPRSPCAIRCGFPPGAVTVDLSSTARSTCVHSRLSLSINKLFISPSISLSSRD